MDLTEHIRKVQATMAQAAVNAGRDPGEITLCAATKVQTDDTIRAAIAAGVPVCGENRVQELWSTTPTRGPGSTLSATFRPTRSSRWWERWS